jgi:hypothetical protein
VSRGGTTAAFPGSSAKGNFEVRERSGTKGTVSMIPGTQAPITRWVGNEKRVLMEDLAGDAASSTAVDLIGPD